MKAVLLACVAALTIGAAPVDWTKTVTRGANGAYVLGNPKAKVRLVEYLSYSCNHCADYAVESSIPLKTRYVAKGTVAVELRNAVRDRYDFAAAVLARCGGPTRFAAQSEALFAGQEAMMAKAQAFETANPLPDDAPLNTILGGIAQGSGMSALMTSKGLSPAAINACMMDKATQNMVLAMTKEAWEVRKIKFTPTFLVNGRDMGPNSWATLEPKLRAAIAAR